MRVEVVLYVCCVCVCVCVGGGRERGSWYKHTSNGQCVAVGQEERGDEENPENDVESLGCLWLVPQE